MSKKIKIGVIGCFGRVNSLIIEEILKKMDIFHLIGAYTRKKTCPADGCHVTNNIEELCADSDVVIDFTIPDMSIKALEAAIASKTAFVTGTTGFSTEQFDTFEKAAKKIPILWSANMSLGINLIMKLCSISADILDSEFDTEIIETHHKNKVDSPSGTAKLIGKTIAEARNLDFAKVSVFNRQQTMGSKKDYEIGFSSVRSGDNRGQHDILFANNHEEIKISHRCLDRRIYANGAIQAAQWLYRKKPGLLYSMQDLL